MKLKPIKHALEKMARRVLMVVLLSNIGIPAVMAADTIEGKKVYDRNCAMCHGDRGRPKLPSAADFQQGEGLYQSDITLARRIENGKYACPSFLGVLTKDQIFNVIAYTRTLFR